MKPPDTAPGTTLPEVAPIDVGVDHIRGPAGGHLILEYGDYECPYSRVAYREIQRVERALDGNVSVAFRHFPLMGIHPRALAAAVAAEAAALQGRFWEMSEVLFRRQRALADQNLRAYATELGLDLARFDAGRTGRDVLARVRRDVDSGLASRQVHGTPTLFVDGALHRGGSDAASLLEALGT